MFQHNSHNNLEPILRRSCAIAQRLGRRSIMTDDILQSLYEEQESSVGGMLRNAILEGSLPVSRALAAAPQTGAGLLEGELDNFRVDGSAECILRAAYEYASSFSAPVSPCHLAFALLQDEGIEQTLKAAGVTEAQRDDLLNQVMELMSGRQTALDIAPNVEPRRLEPAHRAPPARAPVSAAAPVAFVAPTGRQPGERPEAQNLPPGPEPRSRPERQPPQAPELDEPADEVSIDTTALAKFGRNLTALAREGKLRPVIGRRDEIRRSVQILGRQTKSNPVFVGEPGVGKTAIAEGLAMLIASGAVPPALQYARLIQVEVSDLLAGADARGEFERRLKAVIEESLNRPVEFTALAGIEPCGDEVWLVDGNMRAANFNRALKAALPAGFFSNLGSIVAKALNKPPVVGAIAELCGYLFTVHALDSKGGIAKLQARRLHTILFIDELHTIIGAGATGGGASDGANMLKPVLVRGELSLMGATTFDEYKKHFRKDAAFRRRFQVVRVEPSTVLDTVEILKGLRPKLEKHYRSTVRIADEALQAAAALSDRYITDRFLPDKAIDLVDEAASAASMLLSETVNPPAYLEVGKAQVEEVLSKLTGVPLGSMREGETEKLLRMEEALHQRVVGQHAAIAAVARAVRRARAGLKDPNRPVGSFLFLGPTGVGKTELARALQHFLFDNDKLIRLDMSEYQERHTVARLIGAPPGYVGFDEGGQLTEQVKQHPYSVILLDEIEKAHPDVFNVLLQVMDDGRLTDGQGVTVDFRNTILIMTSNVGGLTMMHLPVEILDASGEVPSLVQDEVNHIFSPEFLNRLDKIVAFHKLTREHLDGIIEKLLSGLRGLLAPRKIGLELSDGAKDIVLRNGWSAEYGARPLKRTLERMLSDHLAEMLLGGNVSEGSTFVVDLSDTAELCFNVRAPVAV